MELAEWWLPSSMRSRLGRVAALLALCSLSLSGLAAQGAKVDALKLYLDGRYEESRTAAVAELAAAPNNIEAYVVVCWDLLALERWADAENYALKAYEVRKDPRITEVLGEAAYRLGRNDAALKHFQNYIAAVPEGGRVGTAYYFIGEIYLRMGRYAHADIAFSTALQYTPSNARWWARLGWAREKANDDDGALAAYEAALKLEPSLEDARLGKERVLASMKG